MKKEMVILLPSTTAYIKRVRVRARGKVCTCNKCKKYYCPYLVCHIKERANNSISSQQQQHFVRTSARKMKKPFSSSNDGVSTTIATTIHEH